MVAKTELERREALAQEKAREYRQAAIVAKQRYPELPGSLFEDIAKSYIRQYRDVSADIYARQDRNSSGMSLDSRDVRREADKEMALQANAFHERFIDKHGKKGKHALLAFKEALIGKNPLDKALDHVYDTRDGGIQWGGIIGAIAGGLMAWSFAKESVLSGSLMGILALVSLVLAGAWAGDKAGDYVAGKAKKKHTSPGQGRAPEPGKSTPAPEQAEAPTVREFRSFESYKAFVESMPDGEAKTALATNLNEISTNFKQATLTDNPGQAEDSARLQLVSGGAPETRQIPLKPGQLNLSGR